MSKSNAQQKYARAAGEDYCSYVSRLEKTTSMIDGPHFPNLHAVYKHREAFEPADGRSGAAAAAAGRFGVARHLERLHDPNSFRVHHATKTDQEDVDRESGEFIRRKHQLIVAFNGAA